MYWVRLNSAVIIGLICLGTGKSVLADSAPPGCMYTSQQDGSWSSPATWGNVLPDCLPKTPNECACIPSPGQVDRVFIRHNVTGGAVRASLLQVLGGGTLNVLSLSGSANPWVFGTLEVAGDATVSGLWVAPSGTAEIGGEIDTAGVGAIVVGNFTQQQLDHCCHFPEIPEAMPATLTAQSMTASRMYVATGATATVCSPFVSRVDACGGTFRTSTEDQIGTLVICGETAKIEVGCSDDQTPIQPGIVQVYGGAKLTLPQDRVLPDHYLFLGRDLQGNEGIGPEFFTNGTLRLDGDITNRESSTIQVLEGSRIIPDSPSKFDPPVLLNEGTMRFEQYLCDDCGDVDISPTADLEVRVTTSGRFEAKTGVVRIARTLSQTRGGDISLGDADQNMVGGDIRLDGDGVSILSENGSITGFGTIRSFNEDNGSPDLFQYVDFQGQKGAIHAVQIPNHQIGDKLFFDVPVIHAQRVTLRHFLNNEIVFSEFHFLKGISFVQDLDIRCNDTFEISPFFINTIFDYLNPDPAVSPQQVVVSAARCEPCGVMGFRLLSDPDMFVIGMRKFRNNPPCVIDEDCDEDGVPPGSEPDADHNRIPDDCDADSDGDGLPNGAESDADGDGIPDELEIELGLSEDCNVNGVPDHVETDCDGDGSIDDCESDSDGNGIPDDCEIDCDGDGVPNEEEPDCDGNGLPDDCEVDIDGDGVADACDNCPLVFNPLQDVEPYDGSLNGQPCAPCGVPTDNPELITVLSPNTPGEAFMAGDSIEIAWDTEIEGTICTSLYRDCGRIGLGRCRPITDGSMTLTLCPALRADDGYRYQLTHAEYTPPSVSVSPPFSILGEGSGDLPVIALTEPKTGMEVEIGTTVQFKWDYFHPIGQFRFNIFRVKQGFELIETLELVDMDAGAIAWHIDKSLEPGMYRGIANDTLFCGARIDVELTLIAGKEPSGDIDGDGDTDLGDFDLFTNCVGMDPDANEGDCASADIDGSGAIDVLDYGDFQQLFGSPDAG